MIDTGGVGVFLGLDVGKSTQPHTRTPRQLSKGSTDVPLLSRGVITPAAADP